MKMTLGFATGATLFPELFKNLERMVNAYV